MWLSLIFILLSVLHEVEGVTKYVWVLYGHGIRYKTGVPIERIQVKWNPYFPIHFFVDDTGKLQITRGNAIMDDLKKDIPTGTATASSIRGDIPVQEKVESKGKVVNYQIFDLKDAHEKELANNNQGIWRYKYTKETGGGYKYISRKKVKVLDDYTMQKPLTLREFSNLKEFTTNPGEVFWVACREEVKKDKECDTFEDCQDAVDDLMMAQDHLCCRDKQTASTSKGKCIYVATGTTCDDENLHQKGKVYDIAKIDLSLVSNPSGDSVVVHANSPMYGNNRMDLFDDHESMRYKSYNDEERIISSNMNYMIIFAVFLSTCSFCCMWMVLAYCAGLSTILIGYKLCSKNISKIELDEQLNEFNDSV